MGFDVQGARKAGYSDAEIADHLGQSEKFDVAGARKSGYSDAEIVGHLTGGQAAPAPTPKRSMVQNVTGFMANVNRGLGVGDELAAAADTAVNFAQGKPADYRASLAKQRGTEDAYRAEHPHVAAAALGSGNALTAFAPVGPGAQAFAQGGRVVNALRGATVAGLSGAGYSAVDRGSLGERAAAAGDAATPWKNPVSFALGAVAGAAATPRGAKPKRPAAPTLEQLTAQKDAAYKAVEDSGHSYTPEQFTALAKDLTADVAKARFNPKNHPKTAAMLDYIHDLSNQATGHAPSLSDLDDLRHVIWRDVASSSEKGEQRMGHILRGRIDKFIADSGVGNADILRARDLNTRIEKIKSLDQLDQAAADRAAATGSGGNVGNATRQNVIRFKNAANNLTPEEQAAAQKVIDGTKTGNALRQLGKLSPAGNGLMLAGHLAAAVPTHGVSAAVGFGGAVSKLASDAITAGNVKALRELIATGGHAAAKEVRRQLANPQYADLRRQLANDAAVQAGVQGSSQRPPIEVTVGQSTNPDHLAWRRSRGLPTR